MAIEVDEDLNLQERSWRWQRVGWLLMAAMGLLAIAGGTGDGWLSRRVVHSGQSTVTFEAIARRGAGSTVVVAGPPQDGALRIRLGGRSPRCVELAETDPPAERVFLIGRAAELRYGALDVEPATVRLELRHRCPGWRETWIAINNEPQVALRQFVLP